MDDILVILGDVMLLAVAIATILGLVILVLLEARWILGLWLALHRRWRATLRRLRDDEAEQDEPERNGAPTSPVSGPRGG